MLSHRIRHANTLVTIAVLSIAFPAALAQKESVWQQMKDAAKQTAQQKAQQKAQQAGVPNPTKPGQAQGPAANVSGAFTPPPGTKIEQQVLAPLVSGARFYVSPHGVHLAAIENSGSRVVVIYDNVTGPKFDEIFGGGPTGQEVVFSPDGLRYAYCARSGNQFVVLVDGKELIRSSDSFVNHLSGDQCALSFTSNSKHLYYISRYNPPNRNNGFTRVVFDGKPGPDGVADPPAFSPDGDHYAYVIDEVDTGNRDHYVLIVDGKPAGYQGGSPQWSGDSKHLFTILRTNLPGRGWVEDLQLDGKAVMRATSIKAFPTPIGDGIVSVATVVSPTNKATSFLVIGNKKVPGSDVDGTGGGIDQVVFSPDGKHYAALCHLQQTKWVVTDGKKGLEYSEVDHLSFTADSSKVVYQAGANNKHFIVEGEQESDGFNALFPPVISPAGARVGALLNTLDTNQHFLVMDGKSQRTSYSGADLTFSPDGVHYAYWKYEGGGQQIVLDGVPQPASSLGENVQRKFVFSPDGKHLAHFGVPNPPSGTTDVGIFLDGKFILLGPRPFLNLSFTADSKHVAWTHTLQNQDFRVFIDGKPVVDGSMAGSADTMHGWWDMTPDGTLLFLSEDDNSLKRITITPSDATSVASLTGATMSAANH